MKRDVWIGLAVLVLIVLMGVGIVFGFGGHRLSRPAEVEQVKEGQCVTVPVIGVTVCDIVTVHGVRCVVAYRRFSNGGAAVSCDWIFSP